MDTKFFIRRQETVAYKTQKKPVPGTTTTLV